MDGGLTKKRQAALSKVGCSSDGEKTLDLEQKSDQRVAAQAVIRGCEGIEKGDLRNVDSGGAPSRRKPREQKSCEGSKK